MSLGADTPKNKQPEHREPEPCLVNEVMAAKLLGVSRPVFREWVAKGWLTAVDLPIRRNLYRLQDIQSFAAAIPSKAV